MSETVNRAYRLRSRPAGRLAEGDLELVSEEIPELREGQALVRNQLLSLDPTNRIWMSDVRGYMPPVELGAVMRGIGIGEVIASRRDDMPVGSIVNGLLGWQELCLADDSLLEGRLSVLSEPLPAPKPAFLGALGHTGIAAYIGIDIADLKEGETIVISAVGGAVGSVAAQIAKEKGARVVGIAGGPEKCDHAVRMLGCEVCVDHRADDWREQLAAAVPDGIDVDFENVGGPIMDEVLTHLNVGARISLCGMIAEYNAYDQGVAGVPGLQNIGQLVMQRATIRGFLVLDYVRRFGEAIQYLAGLLAAGKLHYEETIVEGGIEAVLPAFDQLFTGANRGKLLVRLD